MKNSRLFLRLAAVLGYLRIAVRPGTAWAQQAAADGQLDEIVVTGSRVISNGNAMPTPVTVVTAEQLNVTRPSTVFEGLLDLPVFAGSTQAVGNPAGAGGSSRTQSGLNLRGLGTGRTLVLSDGHRIPPTSQDGVVDAASIPQQLLQRVDVVTGGVSAVYGSDAITGVVNFITDRKFTGMKAGAQYGVRAVRRRPFARLHRRPSGSTSPAVAATSKPATRIAGRHGVKRMERDFLRGPGLAAGLRHRGAAVLLRRGRAAGHLLGRRQDLRAGQQSAAQLHLQHQRRRHAVQERRHRRASARTSSSAAMAPTPWAPR